jgi:carbon storage regulator
MLILTRKLGESIVIGENVQLSVVEINKNNIKIGINAPKDITIYREEVFKKIKEENKMASTSGIVDLSDISHTIKSGCSDNNINKTPGII